MSLENMPPEGMIYIRVHTHEGEMYLSADDLERFMVAAAERTAGKFGADNPFVEFAGQIFEHIRAQIVIVRAEIDMRQ